MTYAGKSGLSLRQAVAWAARIVSASSARSISKRRRPAHTALNRALLAQKRSKSVSGSGDAVMQNCIGMALLRS